MDESEIDEISMTLNLTLRKCLDYRTPIEVFFARDWKTLQNIICMNSRSLEFCARLRVLIIYKYI